MPEPSGGPAAVPERSGPNGTGPNGAGPDGVGPDGVGRRARRATGADHAAAVALWQRTEDEPGVGRLPETVVLIQARFAAPGAVLMIVERGGLVVGTALGEPAREDAGRGRPIPGLAHLSTVFVDPDHRGTGIGGVLVGGLLAELRAGGYRRAQLWVHEANRPARRLYTRHGFHPTGTRARDERGAPSLLMVRPL